MNDSKQESSSDKLQHGLDLRILDLFSSHVAIVDDKGIIIAINKAWKDFIIENGGDYACCGTGVNYLGVCDSCYGSERVTAVQAGQAIKEVIQGNRMEYWHEYPCHSPVKKRWYQMRVSRYDVISPAGAILVHEDITETKLKNEQQQLLLSALNVANSGLVVTDVNQSDDPIIYVNTGFEKMTGYTADEVRDRNCRFLQGPDTDPETVKKLHEAINNNSLFEGEILNYRKDGDPFWNYLRIEPVYDEESRLRFFVSSMTDISELKQSLNDLKGFEQIVSLSHDFLALVDADYRIQLANNAYSDYFDRSQQSLIGIHVSRLYGKEIFESTVKANMDRCLQGEVVKFTHNYEFPKKGERYLDVTFAPLVDKSGLVTGICVNAHDITERKQNEELIFQSRQRMRRYAERLQDIREEERSAIAKGIHDELGQRLTVMKMDLSWLLEQPSANGQLVPEKLEELISFVDDTLDLARKMAFNLRPPILDDLGLGAAIEAEVKGFCERTACNYSLDISKDPAQSDSEREIAVYRILQEALTNIARHANATEVDVHYSTDTINMYLTITDNGIGVKESEILKPRSLGVTGMQERAEILNGKVKIAALENGGTKVSLEIPLKRELT